MKIRIAGLLAAMSLGAWGTSARQVGGDHIVSGAASLGTGRYG